MSYVALAVREYGNGRICISSDRLSGYLSPQGRPVLSFSRKLLEWVGQKLSGEIINLGVINSAQIQYSTVLQALPYIQFKDVDLQSIGIEDLEQFELLYFVGLPDIVSSEIKSKIEEYVANGGGVFVEVPDRGAENINVLDGIESIYCTAYAAPTYSGSFWTSDGAAHYMFNSSVSLGFLTTIEDSALSNNWTILISNVETTFENNPNETQPPLEIIGSVGAEFGISYFGSMINGIVVITEMGSSSSSSSVDSSSSSSSSSLYDDTVWYLCNNVVAQWKMNDNRNSPVVWDNEGNLDHMGLLKNNGSNIWTSTKYAAGITNGGLSVDGITNYIEIAENTNFSFSDGLIDNPFSVSLWVYPTNSVSLNSSYLIDKNNTWSIAMDSGKVEFTLNDYAGGYRTVETPSTVVQSNAWNHVLVTYDAVGLAGMHVYVNGSLQDDFTDSSAYTHMNTSSTNLTMGSSSDYTIKFEGLLDNFIIIDKELSQIEIEGLYNRGSGTEECEGVFLYTSSSTSSSSSSSSSSYIENWSSSNSSSSS